ncbi:hypothetical protein Slin14017_G037840 [Septoria linicola]|nr:hypothetical protein Slin14017_G037840 [Septoria linicola]
MATSNMDLKQFAKKLEWHQSMLDLALNEASDVTWRDIKAFDIPASLASVTKTSQVLCTRCQQPSLTKKLLTVGALFTCSNSTCGNRQPRLGLAHRGDDQKGVDPERNPVCDCDVVCRRRIEVKRDGERKEVSECAALRCGFRE